MKRKRTGIIIVFFIILGLACRQPVPSGKLWFYTHSTGNKEQADTSLNPASFIELKKDGSFTSDFGQFDYGTWVYSDNQLLLTGYRNNRWMMPVNYITSQEMQVGPPKGPFDNFESQPAITSPASENPFSKENNRWRIKAASKESPAQLKARLVNHCRFWELYFTWALSNSIQYIDVRSTPTPIKIYGNGFSLKPFAALPGTWKNYFYDEEDCKTANDQIKQVFDNNGIAWPHTENKYKMFIAAFQQLGQKLK